MRISQVIAFVCLLVLMQFKTGLAALQQGDLALTVNYPGAGMRFLFTDNFGLELKGQKDGDVFAGGLRGNYYFNPEYNFIFFTGLEVDYIRFKGVESQGAGGLGGLYFGCEYFFLKALALAVDFGPAFIYLWDRDTSLSARGIEYIVNVGFSWYPGK